MPRKHPNDDRVTIKSSYYNFYALVSDWGVRGKSSKHLKLIIEDQRRCIRHLMLIISKKNYRIEKTVERVKASLRERSKEQKTNLRAKLKTRLLAKQKLKIKEEREKLAERLKGKLREEVKEKVRRREEILKTRQANKLKDVTSKLRKEGRLKRRRLYTVSYLRKVRLESKIEDVQALKDYIKTQDREISKLQKLVERKVEQVQRIKKEKSRRSVGRYRVKKVEKPLPPVVRKTEKIFAKPLNKRVTNLYEIILKVEAYLVEHEELTRKEVLFMLQCNMQGGVIRASDFIGTNIKNNVSKLQELNYMGADTYGSNAKNYFLTQKGKDLIKDLQNYMSYGKSPLKIN